MTVTAVEQPVILTRRRRRVSSPQASATSSLFVTTTVPSLPSSLSPLDLSCKSATPLLASLRLVILSHIAELEARLSTFDYSTALGGSSGTDDKEDNTWLADTRGLLERIKDDVVQHLPDIHLDPFAVEEMISAHLPDVSFETLSAHLPNFSDVKSHINNDLTEISSRLKDLFNRIPDMSLRLQSPAQYLPTLSNHLEALHDQLSAHIPPGYSLSSLPSASSISQLIERVQAAYIYDQPLSPSPSAKAAPAPSPIISYERALELSQNGSKLVTWRDLPPEYKANRFIRGGYRFVPLKRVHLLFLSWFNTHNETLNIYTHLAPLLGWLFFQFWLSQGSPDLAQTFFISAVQICLSCSVVMHTMLGCADHGAMDLCARLDYVGISWLISASIASFVYYGFACHPWISTLYITNCVIMATLGTIFSFQAWFNDFKYRHIRTAFFVALCLSSFAPVIQMSIMHGPAIALPYSWPPIRSLCTYGLGLVFYISRWPECVTHRWKGPFAECLDHLGGGSHALWHVFSAFAMYLHHAALPGLSRGILDTAAQCLAR